MAKTSLFLAVTLVFAAHNAEEAILADAMIAFLQTDSPSLLRAFYAGATPAQLRSGLLLLSLLGLAIGLLAVRGRASAAWAYVMLVFGAVLGVNALAHLGLAVAAGRFMPGLVTALSLCLPCAAVVLIRAWRERWVSPLAYCSVPLVALVVHGPVLALFLRALVLARQS